MCGRFALTAKPDQTADFLGAEIEDFPPRYNIAPTQPILMVMSGPPRPPSSNLPDRRALLVRWGLIPGWTKDPRAISLLFNARSETADERASFRAAMRHRRALVPASGFYEWRRVGNRVSQAYWVRPRHGGLIAFAGLMETWSEPSGSELDTGAILTTNANAEFAYIHERMPVVIPPEHFSRWLDCRTREPRDIADLLRPAEPGFFEAIPVSEKVNKVENIGPEIQERVEPAALTLEKPQPAKEERSDQLTLF
jgi:putative SOS response-associated peptidase YedK